MNIFKSWMTLALLSLPPATIFAASTLTVNDGSATDGYIPFHFYYLDNANCRSQVIYAADQLEAMKGQAITEVHFYIDETGYSGSWKAEEMCLSIAETDEDVFPGDLSDRYTDFFTPDWTVAYNGPMEGEEGGRDLVFSMTTPYTYTGSNLIIQISLGSAGNAYPKAQFLGVTTEKMCAAYTTSGGTTYGEPFLPKTTFSFGELAPYEANISAEAIDFPTTLTGGSSKGVIKISNKGKNAFPMTLTSPADNSFSAGELPATLEAGESADITFTFKPVTAGEYAATVTLDCGEAGTFNISLTGKSIDAPEGYSVSFNVPEHELPLNWTGWEITREYDFNVGDYVEIVGEKESNEYFLTYVKDEKTGVKVEEGNHIREYPNMIFVYMISPEIDGNFIINATATGGNYELLLHTATKAADGTWKIGAENLDYQWISDPASDWGLALGSLSAPGYIAIEAVNMAVSEFNADMLAGEPADSFVPALSAESLEFGDVTEGETASKSITLTNNGTKAFTFSCAITSDSETEAFAVTNETETLEPGISTEIAVTFAPEVPGDYTAFLTLDFEEGEAMTVTLSGKGIEKDINVPVGTEFTVGDLDYVVTAEGEVEVSGVTSGVEECEVPATVIHPDGKILNVVGIAREAFYWSSVRKVNLPEGLRTIGYGAFRQSDLAEINLPSSLTKIEDYAFRTTMLASVDIPEGITSLGSSVFAMCEKLTDVKLPSTLKSLGSGVFYKAAISEITVPDGCTEIAEEAFEACASLKKVTLPSDLTEIKPMTFIDCTSLTSIDLPAGLTKIGSQAFINTGLTSLHIPAALENIASNSFTNSPIAEITVDPANKEFKTVEGVLYSADGSFLYLYPRNNAVTYSVVDGTRGIIGGAFYASSVKTVVLPETLDGIDEMAFCSSALEEITIPDNVSIIFPQAFAGTQLKELTLPEKVTKVEEALVAGCEKLVTITLPEDMKDIGNRAFYNCTALRTIVCKGATPSEFDGWEGLTDPFRGVDKSLITIYCPDDAVTDYKDSEWGDFFENIMGISELKVGVTGVNSDGVLISGGETIHIISSEPAAVSIFDMAGRVIYRSSAKIRETEVNGVAPGMYIVHVGKVAAKVIIR